MKLTPILFVVSALTVASAFSQDSIEAPESSDESVTNGAVDAPAAPARNIDVNSIEPQDAPSLEADGVIDEVPEVSGAEVETAPAVEAEPAPDSEIGDAPDLP